jgi:hypothetical protein
MGPRLFGVSSWIGAIVPDIAWHSEANDCSDFSEAEDQRYRGRNSLDKGTTSMQSATSVQAMKM